MMYILIGPSGCGKTTMAKQMATYLENTVVVNRDALREMLYGYTEETVSAHYTKGNLGQLEGFVSECQDKLIQAAIDAGKDVVVDNTNLRLKYINELKKYKQPLVFTLVEVEFDAALLRDSRRVRQVGESVLRKQYAELEELKKSFQFKTWFPEQEAIQVKSHHGNQDTKGDL